MPVPHDYYGHRSPEPHLHNRHNAAPYIEPDWQANLAKDQLPDLSTIGRGPKGDGLYIGEVRQTGNSMSFTINSDLTNEPISVIGPFPTGSVRVYGDPAHEPSAGETVTFFVDYNVYDETDGKVKTVTQELSIPPGAMGSLVYLYPDPVERTSDDTYWVDANDLVIYNKRSYPEKPYPRPNDIVILQTYREHPPENGRKKWTESWLTFGTIESVSGGQGATPPVNGEWNRRVVFTARTFIPAVAHVIWDEIEGKPEFADVAFSGSYTDLADKPEFADVAFTADYQDLLNAPTNVSQFSNDAGYQNAQQVSHAIEASGVGALRYKGSVESFDDLPSDPVGGDVYNVREPHGDYPKNTNWAWSEDEGEWDGLGGEVDLSIYATKEYADGLADNTLANSMAYTDEQIAGMTNDYNELVNKPLERSTMKPFEVTTRYIRDHGADFLPEWDEGLAEEFDEFMLDSSSEDIVIATSGLMWFPENASKYVRLDRVIFHYNASTSGVKTPELRLEGSTPMTLEGGTFTGGDLYVNPFDLDGLSNATIRLKVPANEWVSVDGDDLAIWDDIVDKPEFAAVATSGSYNDLADKPDVDTINVASLADVEDMIYRIIAERS